MVSSSLSPLSHSLSQFSSTIFTVSEKPTDRPKKIQIGCGVKPTSSSSSYSPSGCFSHCSSLVKSRYPEGSRIGFISSIVLISPVEEHCFFFFYFFFMNNLIYQKLRRKIKNLSFPYSSISFLLLSFAYWWGYALTGKAKK